MSRKVIVEAIIGIALMCLLITGIVGVQAYRKPLGEPLSIVMAPTSTVAASSQAASSTAAAPTEKNCGLKGEMTVLMIGRDSSYWEPPYGADAIRFIKVDFSNKKVDVFSFERDLLLATKSMKQKYGVDQYKLGPAYMLVRQKETTDQDRIATQAIGQVIYDNFSISPDHYITIEENVLAKVVDTVGGITVNVPEAFTFENTTFNVGQQNFSGAQAMLYSRYLKNGLASQDEWGRMNRQTLVFNALALKLLDLSNFSKIPDIYNSVTSSLVTDLSPEQINALACMAKEIPDKKVSLATIEKDQLNIEANETMIIKDMNAVQKVLWQIFGKK